MEISNLTPSAEASKLSVRFYGSQSAPPAPHAPKATEFVPEAMAPDYLRGLWRDRLFDRQTELLAKHVEFSQRQQTQLCEAIQGVWKANEEQVRAGGLDREIFMRMLDAKTLEAQEVNKTMIDGIIQRIQPQVHTSYVPTQICKSQAEPLAPVKAELEALQQQINRLALKAIDDAPAPPLQVERHRQIDSGSEPSFYDKLREELLEISSEIREVSWVTSKSKRPTVPPARKFPEKFQVRRRPHITREVPVIAKPAVIPPVRPVLMEKQVDKIQVMKKPTTREMPTAPKSEYLAIDDLYIEIPPLFTPGWTRPAASEESEKIRRVKDTLHSILSKPQKVHEDVRPSESIQMRTISTMAGTHVKIEPASEKPCKPADYPLVDSPERQDRESRTAKAALGIPEPSVSSEPQSRDPFQDLAQRYSSTRVNVPVSQSIEDFVFSQASPIMGSFTESKIFTEYSGEMSPGEISASSGQVSSSN